MKKLTKTQKNILKKKVLRIANIIGLIVGGLSFLIVLYAIIAGSVNSTVSETSEFSEEVSALPNLDQRALTPPANYDLSLSSVFEEDNYFSWDSIEETFPATFEEKLDTIDYYSSVYNWRNLIITTNVYAPTTTLISVGFDTFVFQGEYIGSAASSLAFQRFRIELDNRNSAQAFLFYGDFSTSGSNITGDVHLYDNNNNYLGVSSPFTDDLTGVLRAYYVPPYSRLRINIGYSVNSVYLDALYIDDIGSIAYDTGFDDGGFAGYTQGYEVGFDDGYDVGEFDGYAEGLDVGYNGGYEDGYFDATYGESPPNYDEGYDDGYAAGVAATTASTSAVENAFDLIYAGAQSVDKILSISIFGSITLGMLLFTPLIIGISLAVIKIIKG